MIFIGDVHGKHDKYNQLISSLGNEKSIQIGDMGFDYSKIKPSPYHKFFKGNHDLYRPDNLPSHENDLGDFGLVDDIYFIRGAHSIDSSYRTIGVDLFENEELSQKAFEVARKRIMICKPRVIASHDAPYSIRKHFFGYKERGLTASGLEYIFESYQPEVWVFGHHHVNIDTANKTKHYPWKIEKEIRKTVFKNTRFICLAELNSIEV